MITGIVVALPEELTTLTSKKIAKGGCFFISEAIIVAYSGAGASNAKAATSLLVAQGATRLISWGCAAGLTDELKPGDLVLADVLLTAEGSQIYTHPEWLTLSLSLLSKKLTIHSGFLAESLHLIATTKAKKQCHEQTKAIALDMESIAIAKVAMQHQLPFLTIRAIADPVTMNLPKAIEHALNPQGEVNLVKLMGFIAKHPSELPGLIKLGLHFHAARNTLKLVAKQLDYLTVLNP